MANAETNAAQSRDCKQPEEPAKINPLLYRGWDSLLETHPGSSFFHRTAWAQVLHETYGHLPIYFCRLADGQLKELFPVMEVSSPWTGCRGVSLPFTDVCFPLQTTKHDRRALYELAMEHGRRQNWRSLEWRSNDPECRAPRHRWFFTATWLTSGTGKRNSLRVLTVRRGEAF